MSVVVALSRLDHSHNEMSYETQKSLLEAALSIWEKVSDKCTDPSIFSLIGSKYVEVTRKNAVDRLAILRVGLLLHDFDFNFDSSEQHTITVDKLLSQSLVQEAVEFAQTLNEIEVINTLVTSLLKIIIFTEGDEDASTDPTQTADQLEFTFLRNLLENVFSKHELGVFLLGEFLKIQIDFENESIRMSGQVGFQSQLVAPDWLIDMALSEDPGATLRLYICYGLVCDAAEIAVQYLQQCTESINPVERAGANVFIPVGVLDQLVASLRFNLATDEVCADPRTVERLDSLVSALITYASKVESTSDSWQYEMKKKRGRDSRESMQTL